MSLANTTQLETLEYRYEQMRLALQQQAQIVSGLQSALANQQQGGYANPSGGNGAIFWAHAPSAIAASSGSWPTLIPSTFTSDIYVDLAGTLTLVASSQTVRWFYKDSAASGSLIPVEPTDNGTAWDAIANSCTAV